MKKSAIFMHMDDISESKNVIEIYNRLNTSKFQVVCIFLSSNKKCVDSISKLVNCEVIQIKSINLDIKYRLIKTLSNNIKILPKLIKSCILINQKIKEYNISHIVSYNMPLIGLMKYLNTNLKIVSILKNRYIEFTTLSKLKIKLANLFDSLSTYKSDRYYKLSFTHDKNNMVYPPIIDSLIKQKKTTSTCSYLVYFNNDERALSFINMIVNKRELSSYYFNIFVDVPDNFTKFNSIKKSEYIKIHSKSNDSYKSCLLSCCGVISNASFDMISTSLYINKPMYLYYDLGNTQEVSNYNISKEMGAYGNDKYNLYHLLSFIYVKHKAYKLKDTVMWYNKRCIITDLPYILKKI